MGRRKKYDVIVIGGGTAGAAAAYRASELGKRVALLERGTIGGTTTFSGCVPVRALAHAARLRRDADQLAQYGFSCAKPEMDYQRVTKRVKDVIMLVNQRKDIKKQLGKRGVEVYDNCGNVKFLNTSVVECDEGQYEAKKFVIATGGYGRRINFPGSEHAIIHSNLWELKDLPKRIVVIGSGATGCQVASIASDFGAEVSILDLAPRILMTEDALVAHTVKDSFMQQGIAVVNSIRGVEKIVKKKNGSLVLAYTKAGETIDIPCDGVVMCAGWPANTSELQLGMAGVAVSERGYIEVNEYMQTSAENIYAAGDVTGTMMLVPGATYEGFYAATNAVTGNTKSFTHGLVASGSFTDPEYGNIGLTEFEARAKYDIEISVVRFSDFVRAVIDDHTTGFCKLIADKKTHKILGAHVVGERAAETVQLVAAGMASDVTVEELSNIELAYPTYVAIVGLAANQLLCKLGVEKGTEQWRPHSLVPLDPICPIG